MDASFSKSTDEVLRFFDVDLDQGLSDKRVEEQREAFGENALPEDPPTPIWELILEQFKDKLVLILLGAAGVSLVLAFLETDEKEKSTAFVEPMVILLILIANAFVGVVQETKAEHAIEALKEYSPDEATVKRNGQLLRIPTEELVPGDVVFLAVGDKVPADIRLMNVQSSAFKADQAILTGEPISVSKDPDVVVQDTRAVKQDQVNLLFSGTTVTVGKGYGIVVQTGVNTAIGNIHDSITSQIAEKTPLKIALDDFGDQLAWIITIICILVWGINIRHFSDPAFEGNALRGAVYYFKIAVALAVAAIPEGLSVVITTCLALGTKRMARQGAIVRKLRSVETLGCTRVICSDKTGTLTTNMMSVRRVLTFGANAGHLNRYQITGSSYGPEGQVRLNGEAINDVVANADKDHSLAELLHICSQCNDSSIAYDSGAYTKVGEPTEVALLSLVEKMAPLFDGKLEALAGPHHIEALSESERAHRANAYHRHISSLYTRETTLEFSRDRKSMSVIVERDGRTRKRRTRLMYVKGAPESILERCEFIRLGESTEPLDDATRESVLEQIATWGEQESLRVLAMASRDATDLPQPLKLDPTQYAKVESGLTFVGLVGMTDPPRVEVAGSLQRCREAGIRVIVITGDNKKTAESICRQIGVFGANENLTGKSYTGREFDDMTTEEKRRAVLRASLFSRTEPAHKQELVDLLKKEGMVCAMTGDGVNDAPALKAADIGVAMGTGTDVAKLASDMVLQDDNFATIVSAVQEGRSIYSNTKQFIRYLISSNIGEVVSIFLTVLLGLPEALIPVQLLWVNLVTDGLPATALGFNPSDHDIMHVPPRNAREPIVTRWLFIRYMVIGTYVGVATIAGYVWWYLFYSQGPQITYHHLSHFHQCASLFPSIGCAMFTGEMARHATTMSLSILVVIEMLNAANSLSENESLLTFPVWKNMYLVGAIALSMVLHIGILYIPFFADIFSIAPLDQEEWIAVILISLPVIAIDEVLKAISRWFVVPRTNSQALEQLDATTKRAVASASLGGQKRIAKERRPSIKKHQ